MSRTDTPEFLAEQLHELRQLPQETEWVEFKCNNQQPEDIGEYISAIANSCVLEGKVNGYLVWGVEDKTHAIVGTDFRPSETKKGNENLENWLLRLLTPRINFTIREFEVEGVLVSMIEIPAATHQPVQFQGAEYIRVGSYRKKLKDYPDKEKSLWRLFDVTPFESQVARERVTADEVLNLLEYPSYFTLLATPLPEARAGILGSLAADRMIEPTSGGRWNIFNLGAILFARELGNFPHLARKAVRLIEYDGEGRTQTKREYTGHKGYAAGFEGLIGFLKTILPQNEVVGQALRKTVPMYPELAIREAVANVIIHQDFTLTGTGPMVEVFEQRLEITNPGIPLMDPQRFLDTPPRSRNEALASFLRRVGVCEERGSGIDKIVLQSEIYQLPAPLFEVLDAHTRTVLFAHRQFTKMDRNDRIRACYQHACLRHVERQKMTNTTLRERFGIEERNRAQVSRVISDTLDSGLIRIHNPDSDSRKHASYVPFWG